MQLFLEEASYGLASYQLLAVGQGNALESKLGGAWNSDDPEQDNLVVAKDSTNHVKKGDVLEPCVGMEFDSEVDARKFYKDYAKRVGFVVRVMPSRSSDGNGKTTAIRMGCNKRSSSPATKGKYELEKKSRPSSREGCKATILFKLENSGKWVVSRFSKDHNHSLTVNGDECMNVHDKEKKIQELTRELQRQEEIYAEYREKLVSVLDNVEKQAGNLSSKVLAVVQNVRKAEAEALKISRS